MRICMNYSQIRDPEILHTDPNQDPRKKILISIFFSKFNYKNNAKIYLYFYSTVPT